MTGIEVRLGRRSRYSFTVMPDWVFFRSGLSANGLKVYIAIMMHVNKGRNDGLAWPTQKTLGLMTELHEDTVGRLINKELRPLGLLDVTTVRYGDNNTRRRNVYTIHEVPEEGYEGPASKEEWRAMHPELRENPQVSPDPALVQGPDPVHTPGPEATLAPGPDPALVQEEVEPSSIRTILPPPPSSGARRRDADEEDSKSPSGGEGAHGPVAVTGADVMHANTLLSAIPWPNRKMALGTKIKRTILDRLAELSAGGWESGDVTSYVSAQIPEWKAVRRPGDLVASVLRDAPTKLSEAFTDAPEAREEPTGDQADPELAEAKADHERLKALKVQQKALIDDCSVCDEMGWFIPVGGGTMLWHDHGKMGLNTDVNRAGRRLAQLEEARSTEEQPAWEFARK